MKEVKMYAYEMLKDTLDHLAKTEREAKQKRIEALRYVTEELHNILKKRGDPRVEET